MLTSGRPGRALVAGYCKAQLQGMGNGLAADEGEVGAQQPGPPKLKSVLALRYRKNA